MVQFAGSLPKQVATWYMTYTKKTPNVTKARIKQQFLPFFKTPDAKHLASKKLKTTVQKPTQIVQDYDKGWKDLLSQLDYNINEQLLIQWFLAGLVQNIQRHISLDTFKSYEKALIKELQVKMDDDYPSHLVDNRIEEQLEIMQKSLRELNLKVQDIWCMF